ncbi:hypothetical protein M0802_010097 [Mischocyttarus mexicanus]|nr:hypothetical protein M0802_010097 [Mischocyttarus mexicanus]
MESNNNCNNLERSNILCSDCKLVLKSIYSVGSASSINECESLSEKSKDRNSLLDEYKTTNLNKEIINKTNDKLNNPQYFSYKDKLPLPILNNNEKNNITTQEGYKLLDKKRPTKELTKIYSFNNYKERLINIKKKPKIIEDRILKEVEQLPMNTWKRQKLQAPNNNHDNYVCKEVCLINSEEYETTKRPNEKYCEKEQIKYTDFKDLYNLNMQSKQFIQMNSIESSKHFSSQSKKCETDFTNEPDYIMQLHTLKSIILNRRKKVLNIAQNLSLLSSHLGDICNTILEKNAINPEMEDTNTNKNINLNANKKVDKSTSPLLITESSPAVINNLTEMKTNSRNMYTYNPYRTKNNLHKKM